MLYEMRENEPIRHRDEGSKEMRMATVHYAHWDSLHELAQARPSEVNVRSFQRDIEHKRDRRGEWWGAGCTTWEDVQRIVERGWPEGAEKGLRIADSIATPRIRSVRRKRTRAAFGDSVDMQRVYAGDLDRAWETTRRVLPPQSAGANCVIAVDISVLGGQRPEELFWNGATAVSLARMLQTSGRNVRIIATRNSHTDYARGYAGFEQIVTSVVVKDYMDPLDASDLFASLAFAGFTRGYLWKGQDAMPCKTPSGRGRTVHHNRPSIHWHYDAIMWVAACWTRAKAEAALAKAAALVEDTRTVKEVAL